MTSSIKRFKKKPVEIEAVRWTGDNEDFIREWTDGQFNALHEDYRTDDPEATAEVFDELHSTWVLVYTDDWIIRGIQGEFYPCRPDVFAETYEEAV